MQRSSTARRSAREPPEVWCQGGSSGSASRSGLHKLLSAVCCERMFACVSITPLGKLVVRGEHDDGGSKASTPAAKAATAPALQPGR